MNLFSDRNFVFVSNKFPLLSSLLCLILFITGAILGIILSSYIVNANYFTSIFSEGAIFSPSEITVFLFLVSILIILYLLSFSFLGIAVFSLFSVFYSFFYTFTISVLLRIFGTDIFSFIFFFKLLLFILISTIVFIYCCIGVSSSLAFFRFINNKNDFSTALNSKLKFEFIIILIISALSALDIFILNDLLYAKILLL